MFRWILRFTGLLTLITLITISGARSIGEALQRPILTWRDDVFGPPAHYFWDGTNRFMLRRELTLTLNLLEEADLHDFWESIWGIPYPVTKRLYGWQHKNSTYTLAYLHQHYVLVALSDDGLVAWVNIPENDICGNVQVWNGEQLISVTAGRSWNCNFAIHWSHDGRLAWHAGEQEGNPDVFIWDGATLLNLSHDFGVDLSSGWSSDNRLAWISSRDGNFEIYVWDGETSINVSQNPLWEGAAQWLP